MDISAVQLCSALKNIHSSLCLPFTIEVAPASEEQEPQLPFSEKLTLAAGEPFMVAAARLDDFMAGQEDKDRFKCFSKNENGFNIFPIDAEDVRHLRQVEGDFICARFTNNGKLIAKMEKFYEGMECLEKPLLKAHYKIARTTVNNVLDFVDNMQREQFPVREAMPVMDFNSWPALMKDVECILSPSTIGRLGVDKLARLSKELFQKYPSAYSESMKFVSEWYVSVFQRMEAAKANIVEKMPKPPKEDHTDRGSCSCCFRSIAVLPGGKSMAHHGYYRPGDGMQTPSCRGIDYPPLENSTRGLWAYVADLKSIQTVLMEDVEIRPTPESIPSRQDEDKWNEYKLRINRDAELRHVGRTIAHLEKAGEKWDKRHAAGEITPIVPLAYVKRGKKNLSEDDPDKDNQKTKTSRMAF